MKALTDEVGDICAALGIQTILVRPCMNAPPSLSARAELSRSIAVLRSEYGRLGIISQKIENATYSIETLLGAQFDIAMPDSWIKYNLTSREGRLFDLLYSRKGQCVSRETLHQSLYGTSINGGPQEKIIDVFICKLRSKLEGSDVWIQTMWGGLGWRLRDGVGPQRTNHTRQVQWDGIWLGTTQAKIAQLLKDSFGNVVTHETFKKSGMGFLSAAISNLRAKFKGLYVIESVSGQGYRMVSCPSALALTALHELKAH